MKPLIFVAAFSAAFVAPYAHAQISESPARTQLRTEIQRTETEIAKSVNIEAALTEAIKGASAAASSVANLDWGVVFDDDYKQTLATRWAEEQEQKALEAPRRTGAILTEKRNAYEADKSSANLAAMLEAELAFKKSRLNFVQARRLWYEEQTTSFARDFAALAATSAEAIAGDVSEAFWDNFKGKMQQAFADIRAGNIANLPGYLAGMAKDILSGISADLIKASMKEYLIADFLQRNAGTPRYVAAYWYANFVLPDLAEKNKIDAMVDKVSAAYMDKASEHLLNEAAKRRAVDALAPKIKNQLMKDPTYVRDLAGRVRTGGATAAAAWGKQYARDMAGVKLAANPDQLDEYKTFVSSTPWKDIADITTVAAATFTNIAGDQAVGKAMEKRVVEDYKQVIKHLADNRTLLGQPSGIEPFVLAALKNQGEWQQMINKFEAAKKVDPLLVGGGSDKQRLRAGIAAWRAAQVTLFAPYYAAIERRIIEIGSGLPPDDQEPLPSEEVGDTEVVKLRVLDKRTGAPVPLVVTVRVQTTSVKFRWRRGFSPDPQNRGTIYEKSLPSDMSFSAGDPARKRVMEMSSGPDGVRYIEMRIRHGHEEGGGTPRDYDTFYTYSYTATITWYNMYGEQAGTLLVDLKAGLTEVTIPYSPPEGFFRSKVHDITFDGDDGTSAVVPPVRVVANVSDAKSVEISFDGGGSWEAMTRGDDHAWRSSKARAYQHGEKVTVHIRATNTDGRREAEVLKEKVFLDLYKRVTIETKIDRVEMFGTAAPASNVGSAVIRRDMSSMGGAVPSPGAAEAPGTGASAEDLAKIKQPDVGEMERRRDMSTMGGELAAALPGKGGASAEDMAKIKQLYQNFAEAYSRKNLAQLTRLMAPDWQAADGTTIDEMEQTLRNSFRVFDRVQFKIEGLDIQPMGHNQYQASYTASLVGHMSQRNLKHEESAAVKDVVVITPDGARISKTAGGKFRMGR